MMVDHLMNQLLMSIQNFLMIIFLFTLLLNYLPFYSFSLKLKGIGVLCANLRDVCPSMRILV
jgi:hypothetical protein